MKGTGKTSRCISVSIDKIKNLQIITTIFLDLLYKPFEHINTKRSKGDIYRCSDDSFEALNGCDVLNITEGFENDDEDADVVTYFPCSKCDERYDSYQKLNTHFSSNHTPDKAIKCCLNGCIFSSKTINLILIHINVNHLDVVRRKMQIVTQCDTSRTSCSIYSVLQLNIVYTYI